MHHTNSCISLTTLTFCLLFSSINTLKKQALLVYGHWSMTIRDTCLVLFSKVPLHDTCLVLLLKIPVPRSGWQCILTHGNQTCPFPSPPHSSSSLLQAQHDLLTRETGCHGRRGSPWVLITGYHRCMSGAKVGVYRLVSTALRLTGLKAPTN